MMTNADETTILVVSSAESSFADQTLASIREAFGSSAPKFKKQVLARTADIPSFLATHATPHLICLDMPHPLQSDRAKMSSILAGLREIDPAMCLLLLSEDLPSTLETMAWLDAGATGVLNRKFKGKELSEPLREILSKRLNVQVPRTARAPARHKISIRLDSLEQALVAETLNVGTGGMFVRMVPQDFGVGEHVEFEFILSKEVSGDVDHSVQNHPLLMKMEATLKGLQRETAETSIKGSGVIVWVRTMADRGVPEGVGIQFSELHGVAKQWIENFVATHRIRAFIPKS